VARPLQKIKNDLIYYTARAVILLLGTLPLSLLTALGSFLGRMVFLLAAGERAKTLGNIVFALPGLSEKERVKLASDVFAHFGRSAFEMVKYRNWPLERVVQLVEKAEGWEHFERAYAKGRGALMVTAHLGNWEILAAWFASRVPVAVVAQKLYDPRFDGLITALRERWGSSVIQRGGALKGILKALRGRKAIGVLCDQDTGADGVFVPFFGKPAWTQSGVARIAKKTGAPLVPIFIVRQLNGHYVLHIEPEIEAPRTGSEEGDIRTTVERMTEIIERYIRLHPVQWVWMHERWRHRP
jgi:KDO2-lipid IV(A) lauroyltransferase